MDLETLLGKIEPYEFDPVMYQYFHQLLDKRTVILNDYVSDDTLEKIYLPLKDFEEDDSQEPVTLIINSNGGSVSDGFYLAQYISQYRKPLKIIVPGIAASMAGIILSGGGKNKNVTRYCFPCTYALLHDGYVALEATESRTADDILDFNREIDNEIRKFVIENTNITPEEYDSHSRKQWFIKSTEMKRLNLIDKIYGVDEL